MTQAAATPPEGQPGGPGAPPSGLSAELYVLGFNGPVDEEGYGRPDRFVWRFAVVEGRGAPATLLAFSAMPRLIAFTRLVNGRQAFTLPTEARRCRLNGGVWPQGLQLWLDPDPEDFLNRYASAKAQERVIEGLEA